MVHATQNHYFISILEQNIDIFSIKPHYEPTAQWYTAYFSWIQAGKQRLIDICQLPLLNHLSIDSDIFLEKHWRSVVSRSVCDYFLDAQRQSQNASFPYSIANANNLIIFNRQYFCSVGCTAGHSHTPLLSHLYPAQFNIISDSVQTRMPATIRYRIFASCYRHIPRLLQRLLGDHHQGELCGGLWIVGRNARQWLSIGHRKQHSERTHQTAEYFACAGQYRYRQIKVIIDWW